jgi:protein-S-isoprenylcysteine O-methyltransferase Ste14
VRRVKPFAICGCLWLAWLAIWLVWAFQSKKTQQRESIASRFSYTILVWIAGSLMLSQQHWQGWWSYQLLPYRPWIGWAGVVLTALGFALCFWARFVLGGNWSGTVTIKVDHELIRTGPYRFVRHPIYTGIVVAMLGTALALDQWRGLISVLLLWLGFTIKRLKEEQFMRQTFGDRYTDYARTTGAIFPSLRRQG